VGRAFRDWERAQCRRPSIARARLRQGSPICGPAVAKIRKRPKARKPDEANPSFIMARLVMLDSVAYWALKPIEVRILAVIEIEHMRHGGVENGRLIVTRRQLEKRGIPKMAIAPGLRALEALGFIEITQRGAAGIGDHAQAHRFRLTYVQPNPTDEWRRHHDPAMARAVAETARKSADIRSRRLGLRGTKNTLPVPKPIPAKVSKMRPGPPFSESKKASIGLKNETGSGPGFETTIYISGVDGHGPDRGHETDTISDKTRGSWLPPRWVEITRADITG
jgi:hypothetical protein